MTGWLPAPVEELFGPEATAEESYEVLTVDVPPASWTAALETARTTLGCSYFDWLSAVDEPGTGFRVAAHVVALSPVRRLLVRTTVPHSAPVLASAVSVYAGAGWHERETHEMFGVTFEGHPGLDPLLLPEGFEGHPLRKDFVLAARVAKAWPGAKEPGESDHGGPKRRQMLPPGVPDPNDWARAPPRPSGAGRCPRRRGRPPGTPGTHGGGRHRGPDGRHGPDGSCGCRFRCGRGGRGTFPSYAQCQSGFREPEFREWSGARGQGACGQGPRGSGVRGPECHGRGPRGPRLRGRADSGTGRRSADGPDAVGRTPPRAQRRPGIGIPARGANGGDPGGDAPECRSGCSRSRGRRIGRTRRTGRTGFRRRATERRGCGAGGRGCRARRRGCGAGGRGCRARRRGRRAGGRGCRARRRGCGAGGRGCRARRRGRRAGYGWC
uniref:NADH-quinone oxidoreductase subunit C n=1 Tax=Streptomyces sp. me109 TaxID=1827853 RepID=UPI003967D3FE